MGCFSLQWLMQVLILVVVVCAIIAILKILVPYVLSKLPGGGLGEVGNVLMQILTIVFWAVVVIIVIYITFALIACLWSMGGGFGSILPHR